MQSEFKVVSFNIKAHKMGHRGKQAMSVVKVMRGNLNYRALYFI